MLVTWNCVSFRSFCNGWWDGNHGNGPLLLEIDFLCVISAASSWRVQFRTFDSIMFRQIRKILKVNWNCKALADRRLIRPTVGYENTILTQYRRCLSLVSYESKEQVYKKMAYDWYCEPINWLMLSILSDYDPERFIIWVYYYQAPRFEF